MKRIGMVFLIVLIIGSCFEFPAYGAEGDGRVYRKSSAHTNRIALTFDDGPHPRYTEEILDILAEYDIKATFFVIGVNARNYPDTFQRMVDSGCEIGNHTMHHTDLSALNEADRKREIFLCEQTLFEMSGIRPRLLRPPAGKMSEGVTQTASGFGYDVVLWSVDTKDWASTSAEDIYRLVIRQVQGGDIILMHDYVSGKNTTCDSLRRIIPALLKEGYEFVTVSELISGD